MADEKKPPAPDDDKTVFDVRRPKPGGGAPAPPSDEEKTVFVRRPAAPAPKPPPPEDDRTLVRPAASGAPAPDDADKTVVRSTARPAPPLADSDRTVVRATAPAAPAADSDRTVVRATGAGPAALATPQFSVACLSGPARGRLFPLRDAEALIGSNPTCDAVIPGLEGVQAKLVRVENGFEMQNLGAVGSLVVGGRTSQRARLKSGDLAKLNDVVLRLVKSGDVFSSEYSEAELSGGGIGRYLDAEFLKQNPRYLVIGVAALVLVVGLLFWPASRAPTAGPTKAAGPSESDQARAKEVESLLAAGEVLFKEGKLIAPPDQPEQQNAFAKFNDVLALDPGNAKALDWLKKIDEERDKQRRAREEEDARRRALEQQRRDRERQELEKKVDVILAEGDKLYERGEVAEPAGRNALARYRDALRVDPDSKAAHDRVQRAIQFYVDRGDRFRESDDPWAALENYRKGLRAAGGNDPEIQSRVRETEARLRSGMASTGTRLILYKDERGHLFVLDEMDKVPSRYRDRAVVVEPAGTGKE